MWEIQYTFKVAKAIQKLSSSIKEQIKKSVEELSKNPDLGKQLKGPLKGLRSFRVGDYRIIYKKETELLIILIVALAHRKDIYK